MRISRIVIRNFRNLKSVDVPIRAGINSLLGENNSGKSNLLYALRIAVDANLSSRARQLRFSDFNVTCDPSHPDQVLISVEFSDFQNLDEIGWLAECMIDEDHARITFRYRPGPLARDAIEDETLVPGQLKPTDYRWELFGGPYGVDIANLAWHEDVPAPSVRFEHLQQGILITNMPALRDVEARLRQYRGSPITNLLEMDDVTEEQKEDLVEVVRNANEEINNDNVINGLAGSINEHLVLAAGEQYAQSVSIGMSEPTFEGIASALEVLVDTGDAVSRPVTSNGLGMNNILYISMLLTYFRKRLQEGRSSGQFLLVEEPEAHLHPQLQRVLYKALESEGFQVFVSTHSTHITSHSPLDSQVVLSKSDAPGASNVISVGQIEQIDETVKHDLERYLDATKGVLLYARKVMLVEGATELFLIPLLAKYVLGVDLDREGISVVAIHGTHFNSYTRLFGEGGIRRACAVVADADGQPSDSGEVDEAETDAPVAVLQIEGSDENYVRPFLGDTTFEREITSPGNLLMLSRACMDVGAPRVSQWLHDLHEEILANNNQLDDRLVDSLDKMKTSVLSTAMRVGKARFAQIIARHVDQATELPAYIAESIDWLRQR